jgi:glyoxylase-like metal-dependent hydrolase (beta-lactamase superfamily II)
MKKPGSVGRPWAIGVRKGADPLPTVMPRVREIAPGVFSFGPWGRTQTVVYFVRSAASWVLIDAGWPGDGPMIANAAGTVFGSNTRPEAILLTHDHPDHEGDALQLAQRWGCPVYLNPTELPIARRDFAAMKATAMPLDRWLVLPLMQAMGRRRREAVFARASLGSVAVGLSPGAPVPHLPDWQCIATPGHTNGHVSFFRPADRVLISGDALVTVKIDTIINLLLRREGLSGPPWYTTWNREAARASMVALARLRPTVVAGGHGTPLTGTDTPQRVAAFLGMIDTGQS